MSVKVSAVSAATSITAAGRPLPPRLTVGASSVLIRLLHYLTGRRAFKVARPLLDSQYYKAGRRRLA